MGTEFAAWLDQLLEERLPQNIKAFNFNLYEEEDGNITIQLIGADEYSTENDDWACSEVYSSEEDLFLLEKGEDLQDWREGMSVAIGLVNDYLERGSHQEQLKDAQAVAIGFVDGELLTLFCKDE